MARYQIILAYDGTGFRGSQRQADFRTVQSELEAALRKLGWSGRTVYLAGRTDTGTHASGQVVAFDLDWHHGLDDLQDALNAHLPQDMAVLAVKMMADDFHPRFDAVSRHSHDPLNQWSIKCHSIIHCRGCCHILHDAADIHRKSTGRNFSAGHGMDKLFLGALRIFDRQGVNLVR